MLPPFSKYKISGHTKNGMPVCNAVSSTYLFKKAALLFQIFFYTIARARLDLVVDFTDIRSNNTNTQHLKAA